MFSNYLIRFFIVWFRGAELIAELNQKEIALQQAAAREVLNKIKEKMEQIKATQRKMSGQDLRVPQDHYEGNEAR